MRIWISSAFALALVASCSSLGEQPADPEAPVRAAVAAPEPVVQPRGQAAGAEWEELLNKLKADQAVTEQQKASQGDEHYRLAERYYQAHDFEKSTLECEKALQLNPSHAPARALFVEVQFILGQGKATPASGEYGKFMEEALVRHQQLLIEIDTAVERGERSYNMGDYDQAEREFRKILEFAKWMPTGIELETRRKLALDMLERTKGSRRQKEVDEEKSRLHLIDEEKSRDEYKRLIDQKRELELLFGQAQMNFEREEYVRCVEVCDKVLYINANLTSVTEMRSVAQRLQHMKRGRDNLKNYVEEWKRTFEQVELNAVVQAYELEFPDTAIWREVISKRQPKGIAEFNDQISDEDKTITDKLKSIRISLDMTNTPLTAIIDYVREFSGLNIHISGIENPEQEMINQFKVTDLELDGALRLLLGPRQKAHFVQDGVVLITTAGALKKRVTLELYDVQDLTYGMADFPGVDISLDPNGVGVTAAAGDEAKQQFTGEDLARLIKDTIHKDQWEDADGKSVQFQNGLLIVRNSIEIHRAIRKFLSDLRASTSMLVSVETRFLSVQDDFLQQVGMDFRDVNGVRVQGLTTLTDINPGFVLAGPPALTQFLPAGPVSAGITGVFGDSIARSMGARVQQIMTNDFLVNRFFQQSLAPLGGGTLQYTLLDDISLETILRLVSRSERNHILSAPKLTLFNTQRGNFRISNQMAYIKDYDIQIATGAVAMDPVVDVVSDGISLDVRPIISADRRFVTLELRPTIAELFPRPPDIKFIITNVNLSINATPFTDIDPVVIETPIVNIQRVRTTVVVPDRGTLLLGGLTAYFDEDAESSIPIWRNIPILGSLGGMKVKGLQRKQTLIICSVRIIIPGEEERRRF